MIRASSSRLSPTRSAADYVASFSTADDGTAATDVNDETEARAACGAALTTGSEQKLRIDAPACDPVRIDIKVILVLRSRPTPQVVVHFTPLAERNHRIGNSCH